jgi:predicted signal transduction protein with EAL and GGDEF domain
VPADGTPLCIGASIGIALFPEHADQVETLLMHADGSMYAKKRAHKGAAGARLPDRLSGSA